MDKLERLQKIDRSQEIDGLAVQLYFWSRSPKVLLSTSLTILFIALGVAWLLQRPIVAPGSGTTQEIRGELAKAAPSVSAVIRSLQSSPEGAIGLAISEEDVNTSQLTGTEKMLLNAVLKSASEWPPEPTADLLYLAHYVRPVRHANEAIADLHLGAGRTAAALPYLEREARFADARSARAKLVALQLEKRDFAAAKAFVDDPRFAGEFSTSAQLQLAAGERRWDEVMKLILVLAREAFQPMPLMLTAVAGVVWLIIALQAIQPSSVFSLRIVLPFFAVAAGMASTVPTLFAVVWQEELWGLGRPTISSSIFHII
jgi:hypothetical protein